MNNCHKNETRERWGDTAAYREHAEKTKHYTKEQWDTVNDGLMSIFAEFSACKNRGASPDSPEAQALVTKLQAHITENYYTCTDEILAGLGQMEQFFIDEEHKMCFRDRTAVDLFAKQSIQKIKSLDTDDFNPLGF